MRYGMRKVLSGIICLFILMTLISGCSGGSAATNSGPKKVVRLAYQGILDKDTIDPISGITKKGKQSLKELLEKKLPNYQIDIITIPSDGWIQKTETTIKSGECDVAWYTNQVMAADWFTDHSEFMKDDQQVNLNNINSLFLDQAVHYIKYRSFDKPQSTNQYYGLPIDMSAYFMAYDKQLFDDWGVQPPSENTTYEELIDKAKKMTGKNPKTGKDNYGTFLKSYWLEWHSIGFNATHPIKADGMKLANLNMDNDVEYIKGSPEVLKYFNYLTEALKYAPAGAATGTGSEKFYTKDNDIAINMDVSLTGQYLAYTYANKKDVTDRFKPILMPLSKNGMQGFPEFHKVAVVKNAKDKQAAWEVVKKLTTDKEVVDFLIVNYSTSGVPALKDASGMKCMELDINKKRHEFQKKSIFITDDYWYWREPMNKVLTKVVAKQVTSEQARIEFYNNTKTWIEDKKKQLGSN